MNKQVARSLVYLGNPVVALRRLSKNVDVVQSPAIKKLVANLEAQVRQEEGVGIAAPQLGVNVRCFLMMSNAIEYDEDAYESTPFHMTYQPVINPIITSPYDPSNTYLDFEGCLSIPGYVGIVRRQKSLQVEYHDLNNQHYALTLEGFAARIFQHELDHLDGIVYTDRMEQGSLIHNSEFQLLTTEAIQELLQSS